MPYTATWTVQPDASLQADYTDCQGDPCHLVILPEGGSVRWSAVATYGIAGTGHAPSVADAMAAAEDEATRQDWSEVEPDFTAEEQEALGQAAVDLLKGPGHGR